MVCVEFVECSLCNSQTDLSSCIMDYISVNCFCLTIHVSHVAAWQSVHVTVYTAQCVLE